MKKNGGGEVFYMTFWSNKICFQPHHVLVDPVNRNLHMEVLFLLLISTEQPNLLNKRALHFFFLYVKFVSKFICIYYYLITMSPPLLAVPSSKYCYILSQHFFCVCVYVYMEFSPSQQILPSKILVNK